MTNIQLPFDAALLPAKKLTSGAISCLYEYGNLRYISYGATEVVRMIYFAVRDEHWNTATYTIENEVVDERDNGFSITYTAQHRLQQAHFRAEVSIIAEGDRLSFRVKGEALTTFKKNRIGLCVLHPIKECAGKTVVITQPDGHTYTSNFPELVSPHQPFKDIKQMVCEIDENTKASFFFEGDIFETEDQRNWADASFKTYSTPQSLPFPVVVDKGFSMAQQVMVNISGALPVSAALKEAQEIKTPFPKIGYERNEHEVLTDDDYSLLKQIPFDHYRTTIHPGKKDWRLKMAAALHEARQLQTKLELVIILNNNEDFESLLLAELIQNSQLIESVLFLGEDSKNIPNELQEHIYSAIKNAAPAIKIGYGTDGFFADVNRNQPSNIPFDFVSFSLNPQVHLSDTRSVIENLERQADLITTAQSFAKGREIRVSPVSFKIRSSDGSSIDYDARQHSSFGAFWTLTAIKNLGGASRLTLFQTKGYRGILNGKHISPLFELLKTVKDFGPTCFIVSSSAKPFSPIVLQNEKGEKIEVAIDQNF